MLQAIAKPFGVLLLWIYDWTANYGLAIILFALIVKLIMLPFQMKSKRSMMRMSRFTPRIKELEKKYEGNKQKYQEEVSRLYKEEKVSPMSGCIWTLIPFPVLIALYQAIRFPLTIMMGVASELIEEGGAIYQKLVELGYSLSNYVGANKAYEQIYQSQFITDHFDAFSSLSDKLQRIDYGFLGLNLGGTPSYKVWAFDWSSPSAWLPAMGLFLIPLVSAGLSYVSMIISNKTNPQTTEQQSSAKTMMLMMPLVSLWICFTMPAALGIYWIAQSVFAIGQDIILSKHYNRLLDREDAKRLERDRIKAAELETKRQETERLKAEGATAKNPNTSKRKMQATQKAKDDEKKAAFERAERAQRRARLGLPEEAVSESRVGERRYARGRAYVSDRYTSPETAEEKTLAAAGASGDAAPVSEGEYVLPASLEAQAEVRHWEDEPAEQDAWDDENEEPLSDDNTGEYDDTSD